MTAITRVMNVKSLSRATRMIMTTTVSGGAGADRAELDTHADTCVGGANTVLLSTTGESASVSTFSGERKPFTEIPIGTVATTWTMPTTGERIVLVIHEALYFGDRLATTLLCPNQLRANGIRVNDMPHQFDKASTHSIHVKSTAEEEIVIPLTLDGVISYVADCTKPSEDDLTNGWRVELTSDMEWTPYDNGFAEAEAVVEREVRDIQMVKTNDKPQIRNKGEGVRERGPILPMPIEFEDDALLVDRLIAAVKVAPDDISGDGLSGHENPDVYALTTTDRKIFALSSDEKHSIVTKNVLARHWGIGLSAAERTLQRTTQRGVRTFVHPTDRRVTASHPHLSHRLLKSTWYSDMVFAKMKSI